MTKDWLIRTKNNHILGPVTKEKIKQLISNGSIKGDDEVCSGNGYWIFVREQDLIARFIFGDEPQGFNPVQEIDPIISLNRSQPDINQEAELLPSEDDLAYPDMGQGEADQPEDEFGNIMPEADDLAYPDMGGDASESDSQMDATLVDVNFSDFQKQLKQENDETNEKENIFDTQIDDIEDLGSLDNLDDEFLEETAEDETPVINKPVKKKAKARKTGVRKRTSSGVAPRKKVTEVKKRVSPPPKKSSMTKSILYTTVLLFFILVSLGLFFRNTLIKSFIESSMNLMVSPAYAQVGTISKKKSGFYYQKLNQN